jgi:hypothetical protein
MCSFPYACALGKSPKVSNRKLAFVATLVSYSQFLATMCTASCQYTATICGCHTSAESVFVTTTALARLECTFHFLSVLCPTRGLVNKFRAKERAKVLLFFELTKFF